MFSQLIKNHLQLTKTWTNYYIGSIHRRMDNSLCPNFVYENKNCTVYKKTTVHLRNNPINLSYLYKCEKWING